MYVTVYSYCVLSVIGWATVEDGGMQQAVGWMQGGVPLFYRNLYAFSWLSVTQHLLHFVCMTWWTSLLLRWLAAEGGRTEGQTTAATQTQAWRKSKKAGMWANGKYGGINSFCPAQCHVWEPKVIHLLFFWKCPSQSCFAVVLLQQMNTKTYLNARGKYKTYSL